MSAAILIQGVWGLVKRYFIAFNMTFGMFCAIPAPKHVWDEDCADLMMPCLPLVGVVIGAIWWVASELLLLEWWRAPYLIPQAVLTLVMFFTPGLIHLDGYMDTVDAVMSRRSLEEKIRILKDPHTGSFAVIMIAALFLMQFASVMSISDGRYIMSYLLLLPIAVISRCCAAMSALCLKPSAHSGYINLYREKSGMKHKAFIAVVAGLAIVFAFFIEGIYGLSVAAAVVLGYMASMTGVYRSMKGVSGDLIGFSIVVSELCGLVALAAAMGVKNMHYYWL